MGGWGNKKFEIWELLFRDMGGAVLGGGEGINLEIWEVLFRDMGGAELGGGTQGQCLRRFVGLVVCVPDSESSVPGSNLGSCGDFRSGNVIHEKVRDIRSFVSFYFQGEKCQNTNTQK